jgi:hypothetical protein
MGKRLFLLVSFSLAAAAWPIGTSAEEITPAELGVLAGAFAVVLAVQCGVLWGVGRFASDQWMDGLVAVLIGSNAYHFAFLTLEAKPPVRLALAVAVGLGAGAFMRIGISRAKALLFALIFTGLSLGQYAYGRATLGEDEPRGAASAPGAISLKSDRNVYLISTESLHSPHALKRLYGIDDPPHVAYLRSEGFRVLDRSYSIDTSTRRSYQRIMEFSKTLANSRDLGHVFKFGNSTFRSFQDAGYAVQFIYVSNYMNLNHAIVEHAYPEIGFYVCEHLRRNFYYFLCRPPVRSMVNKVLFGTPGKVSVGEEIAHLKKRIVIAAEDKRLWLTISHIAFPAHTPKEHRYDDASQIEKFRQLIRGKMPRIAENYRQVVSTIKQHDPHAVIVTFGDHGMQLSRGMTSAKPNEFFSTEDYIEDRYGATIGVYPADFCKNRIFEGSTTGQLVRNVIECLNGNDNPTAGDLVRNRSVFYDGKTVTLDDIEKPN